MLKEIGWICRGRRAENDEKENDVWRQQLRNMFTNTVKDEANNIPHLCVNKQHLGSIIEKNNNNIDFQPNNSTASSSVG